MLRDELLIKLQESHARIGTLEGKAQVKEQAAFDELTAEVGRLDTIADQEKRLGHEREVTDREVWKVFGKLMREEEVSGNEREVLALRDPVWTSGNSSVGKGTFRVPGNALIWMSKTPEMERKDSLTRAALGAVSSDIADYIPCPPLAPFFQRPLPATPIFDKATKLEAINGKSVPFLLQTRDDPFAGVEVTCGISEGFEKPDAGIPEVSKCVIVTEECAGSVVLTDQMMRQQPNYESVVTNVLRGALASQLDLNLVTALAATPGVALETRQNVGGVSWRDLIRLWGAIPDWMQVNGEYAMNQSVVTALMETLASTPIGYPLFTSITADGMYTTINGRPFFIDRHLPGVGFTGDIWYGDWAANMIGIGQDITMRRTDEGYQLRKHNSALFTIVAHMGICTTQGAYGFAKLDWEDDEQSTTTTTTVAPTTTSTPAA